MVTASINLSIVNESTVVPQAQLQSYCSAIQTQLNEHFYPTWGWTANVYLTPPGKTAPVDHWQIAILDDTDQAGALGYHDITATGQPLGKIFAKTDQQYNMSVSVTMSHEIMEMLVDPDCNLTSFMQTSNTAGMLYAYEVCDAVEDDSLGYQINGVLVSDFVTPLWFEGLPSAAGAKYDWCGHCTSSYQLLTGGYIGYFDVTNGGGWQQQTAQRATRATLSMASGRSRFLRRIKPKAAWIRSKK